MSHFHNHFGIEEISSLPLNTNRRHALVWLSIDFLHIIVKWSSFPNHNTTLTLFYFKEQLFEDYLV